MPETKTTRVAMTVQVTTTKRQRDLIRHCLFGSDDRKRKPYRNYYCSSTSGEAHEDIQALIDMGLMTQGPFINDDTAYYAYVTEAGAAEIDTRLPKD